MNIIIKVVSVDLAILRVRNIYLLYKKKLSTMGKKKDLEPLKIAMVQEFLTNKNMTQRQIADKMRISQKSVSRICQSMQKKRGLQPPQSWKMWCEGQIDGTSQA